MKIQELELRAFGPFTDSRLDLSDDKRGLHIVYGLNESGKSSALRALRALLYGIPHSTPDNFLHENAKLKIGGRLRHSDGFELTFVRRKGNKDTILASDGTPMEDAVLDRFLPGVGAELFSRVFGIDHGELVSGGQDILRGGGEVGQSLFAAGLGGADLRALLQDLDSKADDLYRQQGKKQIINKALSEFDDTKRIIRQVSLSGSEWSKRHAALEEAQRELKTVQEDLKRLSTEKNRLERLQKVLPRIAKRAELLAQLEDIGDVVILPADFAEKRRKAITELETAQVREKRATQRLSELDRQELALNVPEPLLDQGEAVVDLHERLGSHRKAAKDLSVLQTSREQTLAGAAALLVDLPGRPTLEQARELRPDTAQRTRIRDIGARHQVLLNSLERADQDLCQVEDELRATEEELKALEMERDPGELRRIVARGRRQGDLEGVRERTRAELAAEERQAKVELKRLGLCSGTLEQVEMLPVPPAETIDRFEARLQDCHTDSSRLEDRIKVSGDELAEIDRKLEELRLAGPVPSEETLAEARDRRELGWKLVRRAWLDGEDVSAEARAYDVDNDLPEAYEKSVVNTDGIADRLRREAARVAENASLTVRRAELEQELHELEENRAKVQARMEQIQEEWLSLWQPAGIVPLPPKEMRSWMARQTKLVERAETVRRHGGNVQSIEERIEEHRAELSRGLELLGEKSAAGDETLEALLDRSQAMAEMIEEANRRRKELEAKMGHLRAGRGDFRRNREQSAARLEQWCADWAEAVEILGLSGEVSPAEANAVLAKYEEVFRNVDDADELGLRIQSMQHDAREFAADVKTLVGRLAPDLLDIPADQAAAQLNSRLVNAREDAARLSDLKKRIEQEVEELQEARNTIETMTGRLNDLCKQAGCSKYEELEEVEVRSLKVQSLQNERRRVEEGLLDLGGGATLAELLREAAQVDADSLPGQIDRISDEVEHLQNEENRLRRELWEEEQAVKQMDGSAQAAEAAEKAQEILATVRSSVERYLRLRMASIVLRREIERYRAENQGQLLSRAGDLFSQLTLGSFAGLQTDYNEKDEPVLVGIRPSGEAVVVSGMSDGTLDQLYLSIRLASLEKYLETGEPMPFVVDDILIRFDDQRAQATLKVLADLAQKTQVIFFTHHSRLVDLAKGVVGGKVNICTLGE